MLPHHTISAVTVLAINISHTLAFPTPRIIGAAVFTGSIEDGEVSFVLDTLVLLPSDPSSRLLDWLDQALANDRATVTAYHLDRVVAGLEALPDSEWAPAIRVLTGCGSQPVIDTVIHGPDNVACSFVEACLTADIPCAASDSSSDFACWITGRTRPLCDRLEIDVIASWRMAMQHIAERSALGQHVNTAIEKQLARWLRRIDRPAAALHRESLARTAR